MTLIHGMGAVTPSSKPGALAMGERLFNTRLETVVSIHGRAVFTINLTSPSSPLSGPSQGPCDKARINYSGKAGQETTR